MSSSHDALRAQALSRSFGHQTTTDRERDILVLVLNHLQTEGFVRTAACLLQEARAVCALLVAVARYIVLQTPLLSTEAL